MDNKILRIHSKYNKKKIFSYLKYNCVLKLIKYNKLCQNELDINKQNYETVSHYYCFEKKFKKDRLDYETTDKIKEEYQKYFYYLIFFLLFIINYVVNYILDSAFKKGMIKYIITGIYYIIFQNVFKMIINLKIKEFKIEKAIYPAIFFVFNLIFIIILAIVFDKKKLIDISDENKLNLIPKINKSFFLYIIFIFLIIRFMNKPYIYILSLLLFFIINCIYEYLIILKIQILKKLDNNNISYHDYFILCINNFILIHSFFFLIFFSYLLFPKIIILQYLSAFKNIYICEYLLPDNFNKKKLKRKYLREIAHNFNHIKTIEEEEIISSINKYRVENKGLEIELIDDNLPEFIINDELSEINIYTNKTLFNLGNEKYLFRYKTGEFQNDLIMNKDIILKPNLNRINVIQQNSIVYILLYEDDKKS